MYTRIYKKKYGGDKRIFLNKINEELLKMTEQYPHYLEEKCIDNVILTNNQTIVISLISEGKTNAEIANFMGIKETTVKFHVKNIMSKLCAENRTKAVTNATELGLIKEKNKKQLF